MVAHACNPSTWEAETGGSQVRGQPQLLSEAPTTLFSLCVFFYIIDCLIPSLLLALSSPKNLKSKSKLGVVAHAFNPSTWEAETGGSQVRGQPQPLSEALRNLVRPCFKIKNRMLGVVVHTCNPSTLGGGDRRIQVRGQPQLSLSLSLPIVRPSATS